MPQPISTVTITRPWSWGAVFLADQDHTDDVPDLGTAGSVAANDYALSLSVRHAQDIEYASDEDVPALAEVTLTVTLWEDHPVPAAPAPDVVTLFDGILHTPSGVMSIGDPEYEVFVPCPTPSSRAQISGNDPQFGSTHVWIHLCPAEAPGSRDGGDRHGTRRPHPVWDQLLRTVAYATPVRHGRAPHPPAMIG